MDRRLNILIIISSLKKGGGAEKIAYELGKILKKNHEVKFLTFYNVNKRYKVENEYCLNEKVNSNKIIKLFRRSKKIAETCKNEKIDTVISFMEEANFPSILSKYLGNKSRIIVSIHQDPLVYDGTYKKLIKLIYPKSDEIITVSKALEETMEREFKLKKTKTIYNVLEIDRIQKLSEEKIDKGYEKIFKKNFIFINIGRLTEQKGQWFLIRVFKKVVEKHPNAKLIILGEGELKNKLQELINKLNLQNKVFLLGFQKNPYKFIKHSNCFVLSSLWEGFGIVLTESLAINIPIISTDCKTGPREILCPELKIGEKIKYPHYGKYGILTKTPKRQYIWQNLKQKPLTPEEKMLSNTMIKIIENKKLRKKYSKGLERAKDFNTNKIIKEWEKIIK